MPAALSPSTRHDIARAMARRIRHELRGFDAEQQLSIMGDLFIELTELFDEYRLELADVTVDLSDTAEWIPPVL